MAFFHLTLMHREALRRLEDAAALAGRGDSAHLLSLLGFELLLKLVHEVVLGRKTTRGHKYQEVFSDLPSEIQQILLTVARTRIGPSALNSDPTAVLEQWGKNFIDLRYPYEKYEGLTEAEYERLGRDWIEAGAPLDKARFRFYPEELFGMVESLKQMAEQMANNSFQRTPIGAAELKR